MAEKVDKSLFQKLYEINFDGKIETKNGLSYVSWASCWAEVKKVVPDATFTVYERDTEFGPVNYFTDGSSCWVKTGVTLCGLEHIEMLPVMDFRNNSIPYKAIKSTDVNKAIQRSLTKACARHGAGLRIYEGEDTREIEQDKELDNVVKESKEKQEEELKKIDSKSQQVKKESGVVINTNKLPWGDS